MWPASGGNKAWVRGHCQQMLGIKHAQGLCYRPSMAMNGGKEGGPSDQSLGLFTPTCMELLYLWLRSRTPYVLSTAC